MPPEDRTKVNDGFVGGGLRLVRFEYGWAADRIDDAYEMLLTGMEAERRILQDVVNGGFLQDVERSQAITWMECQRQIFNSYTNGSRQKSTRTGRRSSETSGPS